jgi:hypothetical protein
MEGMDLTDGDILSNKMEIDLYMLSALMLNEVGGEVHDDDIVIVDKRALKRRTLEFMEKLAYLGGLCYAVGDGAALSHHAGPGDDCLPFGHPGQHVVP